MQRRAHALRKGRFSEPGRIYLVTTVTRNRDPLFLDFALARTAINVLRQSDLRGHSHTLAYVLMPDHLHWLLQLAEADLSRVVGDVKARSATAINRLSGVEGVVRWQAGFHDRAAREEDDLVAMARYIVANPLRAGLVGRAGDYPHWDAIWL